MDIFLNLIPRRNRASLHEYLAKKLDAPSYYGQNLDALYDLLTERTNDTGISILADKDDPDPYTARLLMVFADAAEENCHLNVSVNGAKI